MFSSCFLLPLLIYIYDTYILCIYNIYVYVYTVCVYKYIALFLTGQFFSLQFFNPFLLSFKSFLIIWIDLTLHSVWCAPSASPPCPHSPVWSPWVSCFRLSPSLLLFHASLEPNQYSGQYGSDRESQGS